MSELREALLRNLHMQGCQSYTHGHNDASAGKDTDMEWIEEYEDEIVNDVLNAVIAALPLDQKDLPNQDKWPSIYWTRKGSNAMRSDIRRILTEAKEGK